MYAVTRPFPRLLLHNVVSSLLSHSDPAEIFHNISIQSFGAAVTAI